LPFDLNIKKLSSFPDDCCLRIPSSKKKERDRKRKRERERERERERGERKLNDFQAVEK
jgi:hypothetical protein